MNKETTFNQITLITDGCSNEGISPIEAAKRAKQLGISVNVIGIIENNLLDKQDKIEAFNIADAGGGLSQLINLENLSKTVQILTQNGLNNTIQEVVHSQLLHLLNKNNIGQISPTDRLKVVDIIENLAENSLLNIIILVDHSASMVGKIKKIEEAIYDLQLSLQSRKGKSRVAILTYPGLNGNADIRVPWTEKTIYINKIINRLNPRGNTPTGPALLSSIEYFSKLNTISDKMDGVLYEYII